MIRGFPGDSATSLPVTQETWVRPLGWEEPLEKEMATHSSVLAWRMPWTEECRTTVHAVAESDTSEPQRHTYNMSRERIPEAHPTSTGQPGACEEFWSKPPGLGKKTVLSLKALEFLKSFFCAKQILP